MKVCFLQLKQKNNIWIQKRGDCLWGFVFIVYLSILIFPFVLQECADTLRKKEKWPDSTDYAFLAAQTSYVQNAN